MPGILELMGHIQQQGELGRARADERGLGRLLSKAMTTAPQDRQALFAKAAQISPQGAMDVQGIVSGMDESARKQLGQSAAAFSALSPEQKAAYYPQLAAQAKQVGLPAPDQYSPEFDDGIAKIAQAFGGAGAAEQYTLSPGAARYDANGNLIAERPFAPRQERWDLVNVPDGQNGMVQMERNPATGEFREPAYGGAPSGGGSMVMGDALTQAVIGVESGGDPNAVSPAGARGLMQIMPGTARDPGFGVQPMQNDSPEENVRIGRDYLQAMLRKYGGNQMLALAAYNGGPGRVDEALQKAGGDPQRAMQYLPQETRQYPGKVQARLGRTPPKQPAAPAGYRYRQDGGLEPIPGGPADKPPAATSTASAVKAQQKLTQIEAARQQLAQVKANFAKLKDTFSAGIGGGLIRTPDGEAFDRSVRNLAPLITAVTRVPGVGSMSDYEAKLQEASLPSRGTYEQTTAQQIADLERLLDTIESGYTSLADDRGPQESSGLTPDEQAELDQLRAQFGRR